MCHRVRPLLSCKHLTKSLVGAFASFISSSHLTDDIHSVDVCPSLFLYSPHNPALSYGGSEIRGVCLLAFFTWLASPANLQVCLSGASISTQKVSWTRRDFLSGLSQEQLKHEVLSLLILRTTHFDNTEKSLPSLPRHLFLPPYPKSPEWLSQEGRKYLILDSLAAPLDVLNGKVSA